MEVQKSCVNARTDISEHFTEAHSTKASHHPPEPSTKLLQCSTN